MRIGFDLRPFLRQETGVGVYFKNLLFSLARLDTENEYFLFSASSKDRFDPEKVPPFSRKAFRDLRFPVQGLNILWYRFGWPPLDRFFKIDLDLTHSATPLILPTQGKCVVTVHDLYFLDSPSNVGREAKTHFARRIQSSLSRADGIIAVSRFVRDQVLQRFDLDPSKISVIHHGLHPRFTAPVFGESKDRVRRRLGLPPRFLLFVGGQEPRKNLPRLIEAFRSVSAQERDLVLVLAGPPGGDSANIRKAIDRNRVLSRVKILDYLSEEDLVVLYRLAELFVLPSLSEGFGLSLLEAMAGGVPVAASNATAVPEIAGDGAIYFDPYHAEDIAEKILAGLRDEKLRESLIAAGKKRTLDFDWETTARRTLEFYKLVTKN